jgi:hypothetical protein
MFSDYRYESELEAIFHWDFAKHVAEGVTTEPQLELITKLGVFRPDFVIKGKLRVGVELDGKEFHDGFRDECRDSIILGEKHLDVIYRFQGKDIYHNTADMLYFMAQCDPWIFHDKGIGNLKQLSCRERTPINLERDEHPLVVSHFDDVEKERFRMTLVTRRSAGSNQYWRRLYEFAIEKSPSNLDEMIAQRSVWLDEKAKTKPWFVRTDTGNVLMG